MKRKASSKVKRARVRMPAAVRNALVRAGLLRAYRERPAYQRNDYLGWISQAQRTETKKKRTAQMMRELGRGGVYMNMRWRSAS